MTFTTTFKKDDNMYIHNKFCVFVREYKRNIERKKRNTGPYPPILFIIFVVVDVVVDVVMLSILIYYG